SPGLLLHFLNGYKRSSKRFVSLAAITLGYGLKYFAFSFFIFRVINNRGCRSLVIFKYGYLLSSFSLTLYFGSYFLIKFYSSLRASTSVLVTIYSKSTISMTNLCVLRSFAPI